MTFKPRRAMSGTGLTGGATPITRTSSSIQCCSLRPRRSRSIAVSPGKLRSTTLTRSSSRNPRVADRRLVEPGADLIIGGDAPQHVRQRLLVGEDVEPRAKPIADLLAL